MPTLINSLICLLIVASSFDFYTPVLQGQPLFQDNQEKFIQAANNRIERVLYEEKLAKWGDLEALQELESLRLARRRRNLSNDEEIRYQALKKKEESISSTQSTSSGGEKALKVLIDSKVIESYLELYNEWRKHSSDERLFTELSEAINLVALRKNILSKVKISSVSPGATIKYQTSFERSKGLEPMTAKQPTTSSEQMPVGYYYIWVERNRKATSDRNAKFYIAAEEEGVKIDEN